MVVHFIWVQLVTRLYLSNFFYIKLLDTHNALTSTIARSANVVVISVKYVLFHRCLHQSETRKLHSI